MSDNDLRNFTDSLDCKFEEFATLMDQKIIKNLKPIKDQLNHPESGLKALKEQSDILTADVFEIRTLSKATYELLTHFIKAHTEYLNEVREKVQLPKIPNPFKS